MPPARTTPASFGTSARTRRPRCWRDERPGAARARRRAQVEQAREQYRRLTSAEQELGDRRREPEQRRRAEAEHGSPGRVSERTRAGWLHVTSAGASVSDAPLRWASAPN